MAVQVRSEKHERAESVDGWRSLWGIPARRHWRWISANLVAVTYKSCNCS